MDFNWLRYLDVSKKLKGIPSSPRDPELAEAFFRTSASRAYYAIYHLALELAKESGYDETADKINGRGSHQRLQDHFLGFDDEGYKRLSVLLSRLHKYRKSCDYYNTVKRPRDMMDMSIRIADDALEIINNKAAGSQAVA